MSELNRAPFTRKRHRARSVARFCWTLPYILSLFNLISIISTKTEKTAISIFKPFFLRFIEVDREALQAVVVVVREAAVVVSVAEAVRRRGVEAHQVPAAHRRGRGSRRHPRPRRTATYPNRPHQATAAPVMVTQRQRHQPPAMVPATPSKATLRATRATRATSSHRITHSPRYDTTMMTGLRKQGNGREA